MIGKTVFILTVLSLVGLPARALVETLPLNVIPQPAKVVIQEESSFTLAPGLTVGVTAHTKDIGQYLAGLLAPPTGLEIKVKAATEVAQEAPHIVLRTDEKRTDLGPEGYELAVDKHGVTIVGGSPAGVFYGVQTLRQLLPPEIESGKRVDNMAWTLPFVRIQDQPRFGWRGALLDSGRHFLDKAFIKRFIDLLAMYKINRFHWHLTDDQGWRVEIRKYPKLTEVGAWRKTEDGGKYGGFYTQQDLREIVVYAEARQIVIVPEIEMPGHSMAALASYPQYSCTGGPFEVANTWGIKKDVYCPGNDDTFKFIEGMLSEVMDIFPSPWLHIGGDEVPKDRWKACPRCQNRIKAEKLKDEAELQSWFVKRIEKILNSRDRRLVGWDEILEGGLAPNAIVQSWRGIQGGIAAAKAGHDVVMSPTSHCYLDYPNEKISVEKAYSYEPVPDDLPADKVKHILGLEGNMWGEVMPTPQSVEQHAFPRLIALAEVGWSPRPARNWPGFYRRLKAELIRLDKLGVHYSPLTESQPSP